MTNKEAISELIKYRRRLEKDSTIDAEPFDMAIEALKEQRPMFYICETVDQEKLKDMIKNYPPMFVTPGTEKIELIREQHWIPCSERLPEKNREYLVTDEGDVLTAYINSLNEWMDFHGNRLKGVTAWMPLPEPYTEE